MPLLHGTFSEEVCDCCEWVGGVLHAPEELLVQVLYLKMLKC